MTSSNPNICLRYLYRDAGNYKNYGSATFCNSRSRSLSEIDQVLRAALTDHLFFMAADWGVPDLHFTEYPYDDCTDHEWHEYERVETTTEAANEDLETLLTRIKSSHNFA